MGSQFLQNLNNRPNAYSQWHILTRTILEYPYLKFTDNVRRNLQQDVKWQDITLTMTVTGHCGTGDISWSRMYPLIREYKLDRSIENTSCRIEVDTFKNPLFLNRMCDILLATIHCKGDICFSETLLKMVTTVGSLPGVGGGDKNRFICLYHKEFNGGSYYYF